MSATKIEWCDYTINPIVGCSHCSEGCLNCYAERFAARLAKHPNPKIRDKYAGVVNEHGKWTGKFSVLKMSVFLKLPETPKRVFVGSMTDIFHPNFPRKAMWRILSATEVMPHHTFCLLTKRADEMYNYFKPTRYEPYGIEGRPWEAKNLWLGVTVCNQQEADEKIPILLQTPAAKRFVSIEPMLGPVELTFLDTDSGMVIDALIGKSGYMVPHESETAKLDWVICGAEQGPRRRLMNMEWAMSLHEQCKEAGVPFFFKKDSNGNPFCGKEIIRQFPE
jgi:protein gp37